MFNVHCYLCGRFLKDGACVADCGDGLYQYTDRWDSHQSCQRCDPSCWRCTGGLSTNCTSCNDNAVLSDGVCNSVCPDGYVRLTVNRVSREICCRYIIWYMYQMWCFQSFPVQVWLCYHITLYYREYLKGMHSTSDSGGDNELSAIGRPCASCSPACLTCSGPGSADCLSCHADMALNTGRKHVLSTRWVFCQLKPEEKIIGYNWVTKKNIVSFIPNFIKQMV